MLGTVRENWRIGLLVVVLVISSIFLFAPDIGGSTAEEAAAQERVTNLRYGLELSGGTRVRAPLVGITAEAVAFSGDDPATVEQNVAAELETASATDLTARVQQGAGENATGTVEVTVENVSQDELEAALDAAGYDYDRVRDGVTATTREETVRVLRSKINEAGLSGGSVQQVTTAAGDRFILIEVPNRDRSEVLDLVSSRGSVRVDVYYPVEANGSREYRTREGVITRDDFQRIGTAQQATERIGPHVPVAIAPDEAERIQQAFVETGVASQGGSVCRYEEARNSTDPCILIVVDDEVVSSFGMDPDLAADMQAGEWAEDPQFVLTTRNFSDAQDVAVNLRAGALPAPLDVGAGGEGTSSFVSPAQGEGFRQNSLITGIIAVFAVSGVVFFRYGETRVALPMILTALSEVYAMLGFAAFVQYPLDLAVIAGFLAVIGTGVDDLIIIADEVMSQGEVNSRRVFQSRFRKAFWVIGAAAATTIIAMSPLAVLSLGDLQGFAIFTIIGVLVGVLITRPAYGDILRALLTEK